MYNDKTLAFLSYKHGGIFLHQILLNHLVACNFKERLGAHISIDIFSKISHSYIFTIEIIINIHYTTRIRRLKLILMYVLINISQHYNIIIHQLVNTVIN